MNMRKNNRGVHHNLAETISGALEQLMSGDRHGAESVLAEVRLDFLDDAAGAVADFATMISEQADARRGRRATAKQG